MSLIRDHVPNDDAKFLCHDTKSFYDFGATDEPEGWLTKYCPPLGGPGGPGIPGPLDTGDVTWSPLPHARSPQL